MTQAAAHIAAMQRQNLNGRSTPISRANSNASPAPASAAVAQSPMIPAAVAAGMTSRQNTPVATNAQVARGSPLAGNHPVAARPVAPQSGAQQQQTHHHVPGSHTVMIPPGAGMNPAFYQQYQQQQSLQAYLTQQARQQAQMRQGHLATTAQQAQHGQQTGVIQAQQANQDQPAGSQQSLVGVQIPAQTFNYLPMHTQQYLWTQSAMSRGIPQGQQQIPGMPPGMTIQQMQGLGRGGALPPNR